MKFSFNVSCLVIISSFSISFAAQADIGPAYLGSDQNRQALESLVKESAKAQAVACREVIFIRNAGSTSVVQAGLCSVNGGASQMACANASMKKVGISDRSYPELTQESELRMHMISACGLN